ncbi:substrate-binding domain-containing protein [uncultured Enterovirga sp.]|uniref:substrate-binding domain-containing protein n=1 Tax=uncultured Enterovirga sp. TaxID=2026352 RepID=UPI0035CBBD8A
MTDGNDRADARRRGVLQCLAEPGLALEAGWFTERPYCVADGRAAMRSLVQARPRPTAVICGKDQLALGPLIEAAAQGVIRAHRHLDCRLQRPRICGPNKYVSDHGAKIPTRRSAPWRRGCLCSHPREAPFRFRHAALRHCAARPHAPSRAA